MSASPASNAAAFHPNLQEKAAAEKRHPERPSSADNPITDQLFSALDLECRARMDRFLTGIERYRTHPLARGDIDPPTFTQDGSSQVMRFGDPGDTPLLVVPSLVNRSYILDLDTETSFMRWISAQGHCAYLVDWGMPDRNEFSYGIGDYIARLNRFLDQIHDIHGRPVNLLGYCMGGLLALATGLARQDKTDRLALLATPWDFQSDKGRQARQLSMIMPLVRQMIQTTGFLPTDMLQMFFAGLDPLLALKKFSKFAECDPGSSFERSFVALEDWLNDGVPLAGPAALECLEGWYQENHPAKNSWIVNGSPVAPAHFTRPALCLIPGDDRIVPPLSARALADALPSGHARDVKAGHIGMMAGSRAQTVTWPLIKDFLAA